MFFNLALTFYLQAAFKFNNLYFMTIQHIEKLVIRENYF